MAQHFCLTSLTPQMTTPYYSGKYRFQVELKGLRLPVTITIPDIPDTKHGRDDSSGSLNVLAIEPHNVASDSTSQCLFTATRQSEDAQALETTTESPDIGISIGDQLDLLSVSLFCYVLTISKHNAHRALE